MYWVTSSWTAKSVADLAIVPLGPDGDTSGRVHELGGDAHAAARALDAALEDVADTQIPAHLADFHRLAAYR